MINRATSFFLILGLVMVAVPLSGCSSSSSAPQSIADPARVDQIVQMRKIFDGAKGNWDALSAADKEAYTKLAGDATKAKTMWDKMAHPGPQIPGPQNPPR